MKEIIDDVIVCSIERNIRIFAFITAASGARASFGQLSPT